MRIVAALRAPFGAPPRAVATACAAVLACLMLELVPAAGAVTATHPTGASTAKPGISATLVQCVTAVNQTERSATFSGEMTAIAGSSHMEMRVDVLERLPDETLFHNVTAPGLGVWRGSAPGVKVYRYLKQVTNLSAPAFYRAAIHFRWLNAKGRLIRSEDLRTPRCQEPAPPPSAAPPAAAAGPTGT
jgi:hypothetical protein